MSKLEITDNFVKATKDAIKASKVVCHYEDQIAICRSRLKSSLELSEPPIDKQLSDLISLYCSQTFDILASSYVPMYTIHNDHNHLVMDVLSDKYEIADKVVVIHGSSINEALELYVKYLPAHLRRLLWLKVLTKNKKLDFTILEFSTKIAKLLEEFAHLNIQSTLLACIDGSYNEINLSILNYGHEIIRHTITNKYYGNFAK